MGHIPELRFSAAWSSQNRSDRTLRTVWRQLIALVHLFLPLAKVRNDALREIIEFLVR
jgi:hypothetical protein